MTETIAHDINKETLRLLSQVGSPSSRYECWPQTFKMSWGKTIVSVAYGCERIEIKKGQPHLSCVFLLSCEVPGELIYNFFRVFIGTGIFSLWERIMGNDFTLHHKQRDFKIAFVLLCARRCCCGSTVNWFLKYQAVCLFFKYSVFNLFLDTDWKGGRQHSHTWRNWSGQVNLDQWDCQLCKTRHP